jgi:uncharacterized membrane protein YdjX (TVP38/TMEM64 family)
MIIIGIVLLRVSGYADFITLEYIAEHKNYFHDFIANHYWRAVLEYIAIYILLVTFSIPITIVMNVAGGFFFGVLLTVLYATIGATIGAFFCFLAVRYLLGEIVRERYKKAYAVFNEKSGRYGVSYILSLHFFPVTPFALINVVAGLSTISARTFLIATAVGIMPVVFVYAFAGRQLAYVTHTADIFSPSMLVALGFLTILSIVPQIAGRYGLLGR